MSIKNTSWDAKIFFGNGRRFNYGFEMISDKPDVSTIFLKRNFWNIYSWNLRMFSSFCTLIITIKGLRKQILANSNDSSHCKFVYLLLFSKEHTYQLCHESIEHFLNFKQVVSSFVFINLFISEDCFKQIYDDFHKSAMLIMVREDSMNVRVKVLSFWYLVSINCHLDQCLISICCIKIIRNKRRSFLIYFIFKLHVEKSMGIFSRSVWILNRIVCNMDHFKLNVLDHHLVFCLLGVILSR